MKRIDRLEDDIRGLYGGDGPYVIFITKTYDGHFQMKAHSENGMTETLFETEEKAIEHAESLADQNERAGMETVIFTGEYGLED